MTRPSASVLIVDDNAISRRKMSLAVQSLGHDWIEADSGESALETLKSLDVDLILLDIVMPGMDGFGVLESLRTDRRLANVPVLVISGMDGDMVSVARAIQLGATDFLPKSFDPVLFRARVEACIEKKRMREAELDYIAQIELISAAAQVMEERTFHPGKLGLETVAARRDSVGRLARIFVEMAQLVYERERALIRRLRTAKGIVLLLLAGVIGGLMVPLSIMVFDRIPMATGLSFWNNLLCGIFCLVTASVFRCFGQISRADVRFLLSWAVLNVAAGILLLEVAGRVTGVGLSIIIAFEGLGVFLIAAILRMENASTRRFLGLMIGLCGIVMLILTQETESEGYFDLWLLVAVLIPVLWAMTDVLMAAYGEKSKLDPIAGLGLMFSISTALILPIAFLQGQIFLPTPDMGVTFWLILIKAMVEAANYIFFVLLILVAGAVFGSQAAYITTLAGVFWSLLLLDEPLTGAAVISMALIFVGLLVVGPKSEAEGIEVQFVPASRRQARSFALSWSRRSAGTAHRSHPN